MNGSGVNTPAGWYPTGDVQRYWDGADWTEHTAPLSPSAEPQHGERGKKAERLAKREAREASAGAAKPSDEIREDIAAAMSKMSYKLGSKREIKRLPEHLWEGELVNLLTAGMYGAGTGVLALTDRRLLFLKDGIMAKTSEDFPLEKISSIQWSSGMLLGTITVFASGNKAEITQVQKQDGKAITDAVRAHIGGLKPPSAPPPMGTPPALDTTPEPAVAAIGDPYERLKKLAELRDAGILTPDEFDAKKKQILDHGQF